MKRHYLSIAVAFILVLVIIIPLIPTGMASSSLDTAAEWAREGVVSALDKGFVPAEIQNNYSKVITRAEFCNMAVLWLEYASGKKIDTILAEKGVTRNPDSFSDTKDDSILAAYALGITSGTAAPTASSSGIFSPHGSFSREQAATMILNVCKVYGADTGSKSGQGFADINSASSWALEGIKFCQANGIMGGTSADSAKPVFSPKAAYTRQESIITFNKISISKQISTSVKKEYFGETYNLSEAEGVGEYSGWRQLKGYPGEELLLVYFQKDGMHTSFKTKYIGQYDFTENITWYDNDGSVHVTSIGKYFNRQVELGDSAIAKLENEYGDIFEEWFGLLTIDYSKYVEDYLYGTGENKVINAPAYSYLHDEELVSSLDSLSVSVSYEGKDYRVSSVPASNGRRQLKGFYGEEYLDVFFYLSRSMFNDTYEVSYSASFKDNPDEKTISWIGLDYNIYTTKPDIYNFLKNTVNIDAIEYFTDPNRSEEIYSIVSEEDRLLYEYWSIKFYARYKRFIRAYLAPLGINLNSDEDTYGRSLDNYIKRGVSGDEMLIIINNYKFPSSQEMKILADNPQSIDFLELMWDKMAELDEIRRIQKLKKEDYDRYLFEQEYSSEDDLKKKCDVSFYLLPEADDTTTVAAMIVYYIDGERQEYRLGRIPRPLTEEIFNANGIRVLRTDYKHYLNVKDLAAKGILDLNDLLP